MKTQPIWMNEEDPNGEIDGLIQEFDRLDRELGSHLVARLGLEDRCPVGCLDGPSLRAEILEWCRAARAGEFFSEEIVASTEMALGQMEDVLLIPVAEDLMSQVQSSEWSLDARRCARTE